MTPAGWASEADCNVWHRYGKGADEAECGHPANGVESRQPDPDEDALVCGRCHIAVVHKLTVMCNALIDALSLR